MDGGGEWRELAGVVGVLGAGEADAVAIAGELDDGLRRFAYDDALVERVELDVVGLDGLVGVEGHGERFLAAGRGDVPGFGDRLRDSLKRGGDGADLRAGLGVRRDREVDAHVGPAGDAGVAADEPRDFGVEVDGARFDARCY